MQKKNNLWSKALKKQTQWALGVSSGIFPTPQRVNIAEIKKLSKVFYAAKARIEPGQLIFIQGKDSYYCFGSQCDIVSSILGIRHTSIDDGDKKIKYIELGQSQFDNSGKLLYEAGYWALCINFKYEIR